MSKRWTCAVMPTFAACCRSASWQQRPSGQTEERGKLFAKDEWTIEGDPTEGALLVVGAKAGWYANTLSQKWKRVEEIPFDSERKRMSVMLQSEDGKTVIYTKGAPDVLLDHCSHILWNGQVRMLTPQLKQQVLRQNETLAGLALRNLAFAYREVKETARQVWSRWRRSSCLSG